MKLQFLCNAHHNHLSNNTDKACYQWQQSFESGQIYYEEGAWQEAIPHLGCAFEIGDIIFSSKNLDTQYGCNLFLSATELLANAYQHLSYKKYSSEIYLMAIRRLEQELHTNPEEFMFLNEYLQALYVNHKSLSLTEIAMPRYYNNRGQSSLRLM